jgi:hypothetical protein
MGDAHEHPHPEPPLTPGEWAMLVIAAAEGQPMTPVQLQKALFVVGKNLDLGNGFYRFEPYDYGPFCKQIYADAEGLERAGLVRITTPQGPWEYKEYLATADGLQRAKELRARLTPKQRDYVGRVVGWVRGRSFKELVTAIYEAYPEMAANSVFKQ